MCHCKFHQSYRRFTTRHHQLIPIFGFGRRTKSTHRHWLSGKSTGAGGSGGGGSSSIQSSTKSSTASLHNGHCQNNSRLNNQSHVGGGQNDHRNNFNRHLAMNLENDMYYTVDFSDSQNSPLIQ